MPPAVRVVGAPPKIVKYEEELQIKIHRTHKCAKWVVFMRHDDEFFEITNLTVKSQNMYDGEEPF